MSNKYHYKRKTLTAHPDIVVDSEDYIYGLLYKIKDTQQYFYIETTDGEKIKVQVEKEDIKHIKDFLHKPCGVLADFKESILTGKRSKYKFKKILKYTPNPTKAELKDFFEHQEKAWSKIENLEEKLEELS